MPIELQHDHPMLFIRRVAYEKSGLTRAALDERLGLTDQEFRVEGDLILIGPVFDDDALASLLGDLEELGLAYFDDFFELSGNWPHWLQLFARAR